MDAFHFRAGAMNDLHAFEKSGVKTWGNLTLTPRRVHWRVSEVQSRGACFPLPTPMSEGRESLS